MLSLTVVPRAPLCGRFLRGEEPGTRAPGDQVCAPPGPRDFFPFGFCRWHPVPRRVSWRLSWWGSLSFLGRGLVSDVNLGKFSVVIVSNIFVPSPCPHVSVRPSVVVPEPGCPSGVCGLCSLGFSDVEHPAARRCFLSRAHPGSPAPSSCSAALSRTPFLRFHLRPHGLCPCHLLCLLAHSSPLL